MIEGAGKTIYSPSSILMELDFSVKGTISSRSAPKRWASRRKRCTKGKSCRAACIERNLVCRVELGESVAKSLARFIKIKKNAAIAAHPMLAKDYSESNVREALKKIEKLDPDAKRRVKALFNILDQTKTVFIDWKDMSTNRNVFIRATAKLARSVVQEFDKKLNRNAWGGVAFREGASMVKASPGFKPSIPQIRKHINSQLELLSNKGEQPFAVGKGTKTPGNNPLVTMVHELGHQAHFKSKIDVFPRALTPISIQADPNHFEKFAELFTAYVFSGPRLKELYPYEYSTVESTLNAAGLL